MRSTTGHTLVWRLARRRPRPAAQLPEVEADDGYLLLGMLLAAAGVFVVGAAALLPAPLVLPAVSLAALAAAAVAGIVAWWRGAGRASRRLTAWDICGGLALVGFGAGMISEPAHILQLFGMTATLQ